MSNRMDRAFWCLGLLVGLVVLVFVAFACSPPSTSRPGLSSISSSPFDRGKPPSTRERDVRVAGNSSLDVLRRGEAAPLRGSSPLKDIYFDFDRYDLNSDAREALKDNAVWLKANPAVRLAIEGHADDRGTNEYNLGLGAKRAQAAKDYLISLGIFADRLSTISYGEEVPVCRHQTEECWGKNRRGRFVVIPAPPTT